VNEFLQSTSNDAIYAAGDSAAAGGLPLTPVAALEGEIVAENLLHGNRRKADFSGLTSMVFTIPPLAAVGMSEAEATARGLRFGVNRGDMREWYAARGVAADCAAYKTRVEEGSERLLGAHILGPHAEEQANLLALAIRARIPTSDVKSALYGYPTAASDLEYML